MGTLPLARQYDNRAMLQHLIIIFIFNIMGTIYICIMGQTVLVNNCVGYKWNRPNDSLNIVGTFNIVTITGSEHKSVVNNIVGDNIYIVGTMPLARNSTTMVQHLLIIFVFKVMGTRYLHYGEHSIGQSLCRVCIK